MKNDNYFIKKANRRKLKRHQEPSNLAFAAGASAFLGAAILLMGIDYKTGSINVMPFAIALLFLAEAALSFLVMLLVNHQIIASSEISRPVRCIGFLLFLSIANGNIFCAVAGLLLIKKNKNLEYQIGCYMLLVEIMIMLVSWLNAFKEYVCSSFFTGIFLLGAVIVIHMISLPLVAVHVRGNRADRSMFVLGIILIVTALTGNLFSLMLGCILICKSFVKEDYVTIGWIDVIKRLFRS